jgi:peroxiredoxin
MIKYPMLSVSLALSAIVFVSPVAVHAAVESGSTAPDFSLRDLAGKERKLSEFKGKTVVLEWNNPNCPFVKKHYSAANMQALQGAYGDKGVVWLAVNSTNKSHQDYMDAAALVLWSAEQKAKPTAYLLDTDGKVGQQYGAKTTPHMWVINGAGKVVFAGGIDDKRTANPADIPSSKNFVKAALDESLGGKPVSTASAAPYGCSVKY